AAARGSTDLDAVRAAAPVRGHQRDRGPAEPGGGEGADPDLPDAHGDRPRPGPAAARGRLRSTRGLDPTLARPSQATRRERHRDRGRVRCGTAPDPRTGGRTLAAVR